MKKLIRRHIYGELRESLEDNPVVALPLNEKLTVLRLEDLDGIDN